MSGSNVAMQIAIRPSGAARPRLGGGSGAPGLDARERRDGVAAAPLRSPPRRGARSPGTVAQKRPRTHGRRMAHAVDADLDRHAGGPGRRRGRSRCPRAALPGAGCSRVATRLTGGRTYPPRRCRGPSSHRAGPLGAPTRDRLRLLDHRSRALPDVRGAGHPARRRARLRGDRQRGRRLDLPLLQPDHGQRRRARGPRGARAAAPGLRAREPGLLRHGARGAARPRGRRRRLRRRGRRAQHRVVGGLGHLGVVHPPLPRARRRRAARRSRGRRTGCPRSPTPARSTPSTASSSRSRRGWCATSASTSRWACCTATTSTSACRSAPPAARW